MTLPHRLRCFSFPVLLLGHVQFEGDFPQVACSNPSELSTIGLHNFQITLITITNSEFFFNPMELYHSNQWKLSFHTLFTPLHFNYLTFKIKIHTCSLASRSPILSWSAFSLRSIYEKCNNQYKILLTHIFKRSKSPWLLPMIWLCEYLTVAGGYWSVNSF